MTGTPKNSPLVLSDVAEKALRESIEAWEKKLNAEDPFYVHMSPGACPLCHIFHENRCAGCPVSDRVGAIHCEGTPYKGAVRALRQWERDFRKNRLVALASKINYRSAVKQELRFLKSLLPENQK